MDISSKMLEKAFTNNEFDLYYQPQIELKTGKITAFEALIRWKHPMYGIISPEKFIPIAEKTDFIIKLDEWVIEKACRQNVIWQEKGYDKITVAVNVSAKYFESKEIVYSVLSIIKKTGLAPKYIELEITESIKIYDFEKVASNIENMKKIGVKIAVDDFGTAYSSFNYIRQLPVSSVKIDKSFVDGIGNNVKDEAIIRTIIFLLKSLRINIVAEGVETKPQLDFLKSLGCGTIQGYYYFKPMRVCDVERLLELEEGLREIL